jgi:hypothetical protein
MSRPPVVFFAGTRTIAIPYVVYLSALLVLVAACALALINSVLPGLLGRAPILPVPDILQSAANVLAYFTAVAAMIALMVFLFGLWESIRAAKRASECERLIPLAELLLSGLVIAPNVDNKDRDLIIKALQKLASHAGISSIIAPSTAGDIEDGSVDRLFVTTTQSASDFRRLVSGLMCDDIAKIPTRAARQIRKKAQFGNGSVWLLTWD